MCYKPPKGEKFCYSLRLDITNKNKVFLLLSFRRKDQQVIILLPLWGQTDITFSDDPSDEARSGFVNPLHHSLCLPDFLTVLFSTPERGKGKHQKTLTFFPILFSGVSVKAEHKKGLLRCFARGSVNQTYNKPETNLRQRSKVRVFASSFFLTKLLILLDQQGFVIGLLQICQYQVSTKEEMTGL